MNERTISLPARCRRCNAELSTPIVCEGCHTLNPPAESVDFFDLVSLPRTFKLDPGTLSRAYRSLARLIHPDRFGEDSIEARDLATRWSALLNEAFSTLKDPVKRASYMLGTAGGPSAVEVRDVPGTLLGEVMMLREQIETARAQHDEAAMDQLRNGIGRRRDETMSRIADKADELSQASEEDRKQFRQLLNSIKYFDNLLAELATNPLAVGKDDKAREQQA